MGLRGEGLAIAVGWAVISNGSACGAAPVIWVPRAHNPTFALRGDRFAAEVKAAPELAASGWTAALNNDLRTWPCTVTPAVLGRIHHATEDGWRLTIQVPAEVPPELLDLVVSHADAGLGCSPRSVRVVENFEEDFYVMQIADQHVLLPTAIDPRGDSQLNCGSTDAMRWAAPVLNLVNPRFLAFTGDNQIIFNEGGDWDGLSAGQYRLQLWMDALTNYVVPTVVTLGNHDIGAGVNDAIQEWRAYYQAQVGQSCSSFRMGSFYVLANEWSMNSELPWLAWAKSDYNAAWADDSVRYRLILQHYYEGLKSWTTIVSSNKPCDLFVGGHSHATSRMQAEPYPVLMTATAVDHMKGAYFHFQRTPSGWVCPQATTHAPWVNVFRLVRDWGAPTVSVAYQALNDGTEASNLAIITNSLPLNFYHGRIRFLRPAGAYAIEGGEVEAQYHYGDGSRMAVLVRANIRACAETRVSIGPRENPGALSAPCGVMARPVSDGRIELTWSYDARNDALLHIERKLGASGAYDQVATAEADANGYCDVGLRPGTTYFYRICVTKGDCASGYCVPACATTLEPQPDLVITAVRLSPRTPFAGQAVTFHVTIQNRGLGATRSGAASRTCFWVDGTLACRSDANCAGLAPGATRTVACPDGPNDGGAWFATSGTHALVIRVDEQNQIMESDESNNQLVDSLTVTGGVLHLATAVIEGSNLLLRGAGGPAGGDCRLLISTNVALPRSEWITVATGVVSSNGSFSFARPRQPGVPWQYYLVSTTPPDLSP